MAEEANVFLVFIIVFVILRLQKMIVEYIRKRRKKK